MKNNVGWFFLGLIFFLGCITQQEQLTKEDMVETIQNISVPSKDLMSLSGDENISITRIKAEKTDGKWGFPIEDHEDEFIAIGLHSDSFIKLNNTHLKFLDDEEAVWIHPMIQSGERTVLFDAIYSRDIAECRPETVRILGKEYPASLLKNRSTFESDDKWKVGLEKEGSCLKRVVVFLDGYFYDIGDNERIQLFRNDNTLVFQFEHLDGDPNVKLVAVKPMDFQ